jgi:16S rRNA (uracil1498-N3)-methyltransferase
MRDKQIEKPRRIAVEELPDAGKRYALSAEAARHARVLRLQPDCYLELFDGSGKTARARVVSISDKEVVCDVEGCVAALPQARRLVLVQALPKGAKLDGIVRACAELGVDAIRLAESKRSVPRADGSTAQREQRLTRIAREAAALSGRATAPLIVPPLPLLEVVSQAPPFARRLVFWESSTERLEAALLDPQRPVLGIDEEVWVVVGPEGGLSAEEIAALKGYGYREATLGPFVLRVETAAPLAVGLVLYLLGTLNRE